MALTTTTLSSAVAQTDLSIVVASATGFAAGNLIKIDSEVMQVAQNYSSGTTIPVLRGRDGTVQTAHAKTANVNTFLSSDETNAPPSAITFPSHVPRLIASYSVNGAITLPTAGQDVIAVLNGTSALSMTLASPTKELDGCMLYIVANGKAAHTVTYTGGVGAGGTGMDVGTFATTEQTGVALMAVNGVWVLWANGIGSAGTQVAGVVWA